MTTPAPTFLIQTLDGHTYQKGDTNPTTLGDADATLDDYEHQGDFIDLTYTGGLTIGIPEARIAQIATLDPREDSA